MSNTTLVQVKPRTDGQARGGGGRGAAPLIDHRIDLDVKVNTKVPSEAPTQTKKKRASRPKARSGCITCKIRRVKCDERKPTCFRCEKADIKCDGYVKEVAEARKTAERRALIAAGQSAKRQILPRPEGSTAAAGRQTTATGAVGVVSRHSSATPTLRINPTSLRLDPSDVSYYDLFRRQLVKDLSGSCHSDFWSRIVLCEAARDPCVRESVLAIGALARTLFFATATSNRLGSMVPRLRKWEEIVSCEGYIDHHHNAALRHHVSAVSEYRRRIQQAGLSSRSVVIMTLLLIAFEFIQGNMKSVDSLMMNGMRLIQDSVSIMKGPMKKSIYDLRSSPESTPSPASTTSATLTLSSSSSSSSFTASPSPSPPHREEEIDDIGHLLPCLSLMSGFTHFFNSHRATIHLMNSTPTPELPEPGVTPVARLQTLWGQYFTRAVVFIMRAMQLQLASLPHPDPDAALREQPTHLACIRMWGSVLDQYLADDGRAASPTGEPLDEATRRALKMIQIHRLVVRIVVACCLDRSDMAYDAYEPHFRELLGMTVDFMRSDPEPLSRIAFTFAEGLTTPLTVIVSKCRNHDLRMRAARLMASLSWRDGAWDGKALVVGKMGVVMLEESARDADGRVPAGSRWGWMDAKWDLERREVVSTYLRLNASSSEEGAPTYAQLVLDIDSPLDACGRFGCHGRHDPYEPFSD
ncbi:hypothetical protein CSOJ01_02356 [Colletotrichum sojae]|uniref:Zn(2)-C6 fungal-type domain-containing protein n=1 Tax=Colletotrichum sojae TaxID=2175907 RepID=A0A8H6JQC1_9PEZI|nr:hypothetical protein CSOJ01_02356 [Colletotrichum sojae]